MAASGSEYEATGRCDGMLGAPLIGVRVFLLMLIATGCVTASPPAAQSGAQGLAQAGRRHDQPAMEGSPVPATSGSPDSGAESKPMPTPIDALGTDLATAFWGYNLIYYAGAVAVTVAMVHSGADDEVHDRFGGDLQSGGWSDVANIGGYVVPAITGPSIWIIGAVARDRTLAGAGSAAILAAVVTTATTGALKLAIGRPHPDDEDAVDQADFATEFDPFKNAIGSWPSGHTASTVSIAAALTAYAPEKHWIPVVGYPLGLGLGLAMVGRDSHWASDVVAGALVGHAIGYSIGRNFRERVRGERTDERALQVTPLIESQGVALSGRW